MTHQDARPLALAVLSALEDVVLEDASQTTNERIRSICFDLAGFCWQCGQNRRFLDRLVEKVAERLNNSQTGH